MASRLATTVMDDIADPVELTDILLSLTEAVRDIYQRLAKARALR